MIQQVMGIGRLSGQIQQLDVDSSDALLFQVVVATLAILLHNVQVFCNSTS
jgi:hypothetical protein